MPQEMKLMADYYAWPLWKQSGGDVDPTTLPISADLQHRLRAWADIYDATLNQDDPASSGFSSSDAAHEWDAQGMELWRDLQRELGPGFVVRYYSWARKELLSPPAATAPSE